MTSYVNVLNIVSCDINEKNIKYSRGTFGQLSKSGQELVRKYVSETDEILFVETPSFWKSNAIVLIAALIGTIGFFICLPLVSSNITIYLVLFPAVLILTAVGGFFYHKKKFYVLTKEKIIIHPGYGDLLQFKLNTLVSVEIEFNPLFCMREIILRRKVPNNKIPKQEFISALSPGILKEFKEYLQSHIQSQLTV